jgi:hypothetical protein
MYKTCHSPSHNCSRFRFVRADTVLSRSLVWSVQNSAELRVSTCTPVFQTLLYFHWAFFCVFVCAVMLFACIRVSVGIATRYRLDGPGIESGWEARFSAPVQTGPCTHPAPYTMCTGSFPGVKRPERGVDDPPRLVTKLKTE